MKAGIKFTVGGKTYDDATASFEEMSSKLKIIKKSLGDLTKPYDEISSGLLANIRNRFNDNTFGNPIYSKQKSGFTRQVRKVRGASGDTTLKATGRLRDSVHRVPSPTKNELGEQREVFVLRIGSSRVPYALKQLEGGTWEVPVRVNDKGRKFLDVDKIDDAIMSNAEYWGKRWKKISTFETDEHIVQVPSRNFLALFPEDREFIDNIINEWLTKIDIS